MTYINITRFVLINYLEKDHYMIETRRLKLVAIFIQTILSLKLFFVFFVVDFALLSYLLFSLSLTLVIATFYCLNYTLLLLHLITTHLVSHLSLSSIVFIISTLIISIFYCLNYTLLLLHLFITHLVIDFIITM